MKSHEEGGWLDNGDDSQWHGILKLGVQFSQRQVHWVDIHTYTLYIVVQCQKRWRRGHIFTVNMQLPWINENLFKTDEITWTCLNEPRIFSACVFMSERDVRSPRNALPISP